MGKALREKKGVALHRAVVHGYRIQYHCGTEPLALGLALGH